MYRDMSNCLECGRLVAPSSGTYGPDTSKIFCCRRCLRSYYDEHPGLWEAEEEAIQFRRDEEVYRVEQERLLSEQLERELAEKTRKSTISRWSLFCILLLISLLLGHLICWVIFFVYILWMINRWSNS